MTDYPPAPCVRAIAGVMRALDGRDPDAEPPADLRGADLAGADLAGADLRYADMRRAIGAPADAEARGAIVA